MEEEGKKGGEGDCHDGLTPCSSQFSNANGLDLDQPDGVFNSQMICTNGRVGLLQRGRSGTTSACGAQK